MPDFDERKRGFENKFAHDETMKFKAVARGNKLAGLWAAELLGKSGDDAEEYAKEVVRSDFEEAGDEDVIRKLKADLGNLSTDAAIRAKLTECRLAAMDQIARAADAG